LAPGANALKFLPSLADIASSHSLTSIAGKTLASMTCTGDTLWTSLFAQIPTPKFERKQNLSSLEMYLFRKGSNKPSVENAFSARLRALRSYYSSKIC
jgi:hypothetical protein